MRTMNKKIRVGIIFGGRSAEHEVSVRSARNVFEALDKAKYEPVLIGIEKSGKWLLQEPEVLRLGDGNLQEVSGIDVRQSLSLVPAGVRGVVESSQGGFAQPLDVVFPVLHGPYGEDGTMQGLLKLLNVPFVGAGVLGSAVGMDKDVMKRLWREAGIPTPKFIAMYRNLHIAFSEVQEALGMPLFVKPANLGSSVGISKAKDEAEYMWALADAFLYDHKVLVEEYIKGQEIECAVLGNENPIASICGEVIPHHEFYSYEAKYLDENGAALEIPAKLSEDISERVRKLAVDALKVLCLEGMARVDFFVRDNGEILLNEVNTIPGFTNISMYPKLWEASGMPYAKLIDRLIELALERHARDEKLKISVL